MAGSGQAAPPAVGGSETFVRTFPKLLQANQVGHLINNEQTEKLQDGELFHPQAVEHPTTDSEGNTDQLAAGTPQDSIISPRAHLSAQVPPELHMKEIRGATAEPIRDSQLEREALSHVRRLQSVPVSYIEVDKFLCSIEDFARRFGKEDQLLDIAEGQMDFVVRYFYNKRMGLLFPDRKKDYKTLVDLMLKLLCLGSPGAFLLRELRQAPPHKALKLYVEMGLLHDAYTRLCERTNTEVKRKEASLAPEYLSRLPARLAEQTRRVARNFSTPNLFAYAVMARSVDSHLNGNW